MKIEGSLAQTWLAVSLRVACNVVLLLCIQRTRPPHALTVQCGKKKNPYFGKSVGVGFLPSHLIAFTTDTAFEIAFVVI